MREQKLTFHFYTIGSGADFRLGKLYLLTQDKHLRFQATSGLSGYQNFSDSWRLGKGAIPPCEVVSISNYVVDTFPIHMPSTRGIKGNFYRIYPFNNSVKMSHGAYTRGDFGIHQDEGVRGTAGCIGITKGMHWKAFEAEMQNLFSQGFQTLKLFVPRRIVN